MFLAATLETQGQISEKALAEAFDIIDKENKGFISKEVSLTIAVLVYMLCDNCTKYE